MMTIALRGTEIAYTRSEPKGRRVLLLHGWGCDGSLMKSIENALVSDFEVLIPDFPGHGKSGRPPEPWGVPEYAGALKEMLERLDFLPCSVIAHSFGCRVAAWIAAEDPEAFEKIIFTGAAGIRPKQTEEGRKRSEQFQKMKKIAQGIGKIPMMGSAADRMQEKLRQKYGSRDYNALDEEMRKTFVKVISLDLTDLYGKIRQSTLLIWGDADTETPVWMGREMEKRIPDCGMVLLEGGSHFAYLEQSERFNTIARYFLTEG